MPENMADRVCARIKAMRAPIVVGLDPVVSRIPTCYFPEDGAGDFRAAGEAIYRFTADTIDAVAPLAPLVKTKRLRRDMPHSLFLVPGYGAQGADASDIGNCFNPDGDGAVVSASRSVLYAYEQSHTRESCTREAYREAVGRAVAAMRQDVRQALEKHCPALDY